MKHLRKTSSRFLSYVSLFFIFFIFAAINYIGYKKHARADFSISRYLTLSEQTLKLIGHLSQPITIISFIAEEPDKLASLIQEDVNNLLREYQYRSTGKIIVQTVHPFTSEEALQVVQKYKISNAENVLIIVSGEQFRVLKVAELATMDNTGLIYGEAPKIKTFNAEAEISGAIMSMVQGKKAKIYFTSGHSELDPLSKDEDSQGASLLAGRMKGQNCDVQKIDLAQAPQVPADADSLVILGPQYPFSNDEITRLKMYLQNKGRLLLFLDPQYKTGLENLLENYGVIFNDDIVIQPVVALSNDGLAQAFSLDAIGSAFAEHPVISWIRPMNTHLSLRVSRSISIHENSDKLNSSQPTEVTALIQTGEKSWGETQYKNLQADTTNFDSKTDHAGPLTLAVAIDVGAVQGGQVNLQGSKIIAVGSANFLSNRRMDSLQVDFCLNAMNWMLERKESLGITPKASQEFAVTLTLAQKRTLALFVLAIVPLIGVFAGAWIWVRRRRWASYEK
ncbi:MAG: GldG family protein [Verrucomicrobiota bacterium]